MKVRCICQTAKSLKSYEHPPILQNDVFGRFGVTELHEYEVEVGKEYLVLGIIIFNTHQAYLIDENGLISTFPCQLFELVDMRINANWFFRLVEKNEQIYPYVQAIFGYEELCKDVNSYMNLLVEMDEDAKQKYFKRKLEFEREFK